MAFKCCEHCKNDAPHDPDTHGLPCGDDPVPTASIERAGVKTVRWPGGGDSDPVINLSVDDAAAVSLTEHQADEALEQLAYVRRRQVMPRG